MITITKRYQIANLTFIEVLFETDCRYFGQITKNDLSSLDMHNLVD